MMNLNTAANKVAELVNVKLSNKKSRAKVVNALRKYEMGDITKSDFCKSCEFNSKKLTVKQLDEIIEDTDFGVEPDAEVQEVEEVKGSTESEESTTALVVDVVEEKEEKASGSKKKERVRAAKDRYTCIAEVYASEKTTDLKTLAEKGDELYASQDQKGAVSNVAQSERIAKRVILCIDALQAAGVIEA